MSPCSSHAFLTGNSVGLKLVFDGIVAGLEAQRQEIMAKKWRRREVLSMDVRTEVVDAYVARQLKR